ncbi:MAG: fumarylacetoacetate hydrolase family protein [Chitinispirillaceae bacterium]|nr:fumarylacetoacetate hydrolase family protein [Chitinispirillaceae bacterium]
MPSTAEDIQRVFCIGMNYVEHIRELGNEIPAEPAVFMKSPLSVVPPGGTIHIPAHGGGFQYEVEVVVKIGREGRAKNRSEALSFVSALSLGLDLTLRDEQTELRKKGLPWEKCKSFEQSAPLGDFIPYDGSFRLDDISFGCKVNDRIRQQGSTSGMLFSIPDLIVVLGKVWLLRPGDVVYTGTPPGIGPLRAGDTIQAFSDRVGTFEWKIVE